MYFSPSDIFSHLPSVLYQGRRPPDRSIFITRYFYFVLEC